MSASMRLALAVSAIITAVCASLASASVPGDLDGDGVRDVIVRAPESGEELISGSVQIYSGSDASLIADISAPIEYGLFGFEAVAVGDLNGDGSPEIAISAPAAVFDLDRLGAAFLYDGATFELMSVAVPEPGEMLLWELAGTRDLDADGTGDLLVRTLVVGPDNIMADGWALFSGATGARLTHGEDPDFHWPFLARAAELYSVPTPNKDLNGDKVIDYLDAIEVAQLVGSQVSPASTGDVVIDGRIDTSDFAAIIAALGLPSDPLDRIVSEPAPWVDPATLPGWAERAGDLICSLICWPGYICDRPFSRPHPVLRNTPVGPVAWLWCIDDIDPPGCPGALPSPVVTFERRVLPVGSHDIVSSRSAYIWEVRVGSHRLHSWTTDGSGVTGSVFTYNPIFGVSGSLLVQAWYTTGCGGRFSRLMDVTILPCTAAPQVRMESDRWTMDADDHLTIAAVVDPSLTGAPVWEVLAGHEFLQGSQVVNDQLLLYSGATTGVVAVRLTTTDAGPCSTDLRLVFIRSAFGNDTDGDGVSDLCEQTFGADPLDPDSTPSAGFTDSDNDGLTDLEECELGTDWNYYDSDGDGLPDGFEVDNGTDPNNSDTDGDGVPDSDEDSDGDGLSNHDEVIFGTDPNNPDSDGDGTSDADEANQASDPNDPSDGGQPPPPNEVVQVNLTIGDYSSSHSERWAMTVGPISLRAPGHGEVINRVFKFRRGQIYPVTIQHLGSVLPWPDYDYTASIELASDGCIKIKNAAGILGDFADVNGPPPGSAQLFLPLVDIDIDSDNDNGYGTPAGSGAEDEIEDRRDLPGKVFLAATLDADRDSVPDFADGFDLLTQLPHDDDAIGSRLIPIVVHAGGFDADADKVRVKYNASDPLAVDVTLTDPFVPPGGTLRLWRIPPGLPRYGHAVLDGGDFIAPGLYDPQDLGLDADGPVTWYLEAVREATDPGEMSLEIQLVPALGGTAYECVGQDAAPLDRVRVTPTRVELLARGLGEEDFFEIGGLIATTLDDPTEPDYEPPSPGMTAGSWLTYVLRVHDPRPGINQVTIDGQPLPLTPAAGGGYETPEFVCLPAIVPPGADLPPYPAVTPGPGEITWEYNPSWELAAKPEFERQPAYMRQLHREVDRAVADLETSNWNGLTSIDGTTYAPNDDGAFGKEVHKRASLRLTGSRWMTDVWVLESDNRVIAIGGTQPSGYASTELTQVDVIRLKQGYRPQVGDVLDPARIDDVIEIKTSLNAELTENQESRLKKVVGGRDIRKGVPVRRWTRARGWHDHRRGLNIRKTFIFAGGAAVAGLTSAYTIFHYTEHEEQFVAEIEPLIENFRSEQNDAFRALYAAEIIDKMGSYLGRFMVDDTVVDILKLATIYKIPGED